MISTDPTADGPDPTRPCELRAQLRPRQFLTIGIGAIMGVGWAIVLGEWLSAAAPLGTILGFVAGGLIMLPAAMCYAELATALPAAGGEVVYLRTVFGLRASFMVGWFLVLMSTVITSFEAISLPWFLDQLLPGLKGPIAYSLLHQDIGFGSLAIGVGGVLLVTFVNYLGADVAGRFQELFTYVKSLAIGLFVLAAILWGSLSNMHPLWAAANARPAILGSLWIASTASLWYAGFQVVPQAIEERAASTPLSKVGKMTVLSVLLGVVFYSAVVLASTLTVPWRALIAAPLPAAAAIDAAMPVPWLAKAVLGAIVLGILATWNSAFLWATRLLLALGRQRSIPPGFARIGHHQSPATSVAFVGAAGLLGMLLGRGALVPIINMASISLTFSYAMTCWAVLRLRRQQPALARPYRVPGGRLTILAALVLTSLMSLVALLEPLTRSRGVPLEWILLAAWGGLGLLLVRRGAAQARA